MGLQGFRTPGLLGGFGVAGGVGSGDGRCFFLGIFSGCDGHVKEAIEVSPAARPPFLWGQKKKVRDRFVWSGD